MGEDRSRLREAMAWCNCGRVVRPAEGAKDGWRGAFEQPLDPPLPHALSLPSPSSCPLPPGSMLIRAHGLSIDFGR